MVKEYLYLFREVGTEYAYLFQEVGTEYLNIFQEVGTEYLHIFREVGTQNGGHNHLWKKLDIAPKYMYNIYKYRHNTLRELKTFPHT